MHAAKLFEQTRQHVCGQVVGCGDAHVARQAPVVTAHFEFERVHLGLDALGAARCSVARLGRGVPARQPVEEAHAGAVLDRVDAAEYRAVILTESARGAVNRRDRRSGRSQGLRQGCSTQARLPASQWLQLAQPSTDYCSLQERKDILRFWGILLQKPTAYRGFHWRRRQLKRNLERKEP